MQHSHTIRTIRQQTLHEKENQNRIYLKEDKKMTTEFTWKKEPIMEKIRRLTWLIKNIPIMLSYEIFIIKRKNWQTEKEWTKMKDMTYKNITKEIKKQWYKKSKKLRKKWNEKPHG